MVEKDKAPMEKDATRETATSRDAEKREKAVKPTAKSPLDPIADLYEVGQWKGMPRWQCKLCPWDTLEGEEVIRKHIVTTHMAPPPKEEPKQVLVADRFGNVVEGGD